MAGFHPLPINRLCNIFSRYHFQLKDDTTFFTSACQAIRFTHSNQLTHTIPLQDIVYRDNLYELLYQHVSLLRQGYLYESFLIYGSNLHNYSFVYTEKENYLLLFDIPGQQLTLSVGHFTETEQLAYIANLFCSFICHLRSIASSLLMIEHILLDHSPASSHRLSLILPRWSKGVCKPEKFRELALKRLPAHLEVQFLWLKETDFTQLEKLYLKWRQALAEQDQAMVCTSATLLSGFLHQWPFKIYNIHAYNW